MPQLADVIDTESCEDPWSIVSGAQILVGEENRKSRTVIQTVNSNTKEVLFSTMTTSPISDLVNLDHGWDGFDAPPLSASVIRRADMFWRMLERYSANVDAPRIDPGAEDFVAFTWMDKYPSKRLDVWVYGQPSQFAEWIVEENGIPKMGTASTLAELITVVNDYLAHDPSH